MKYFLGIDIGGTKTSVCISDDNFNILDIETFPTQSNRGAQSLVERIRLSYNKLCNNISLKSRDILFAGVACPGPLDVKSGTIVHIATMGFCNVPIKAMLEEALALPVFLENDANCAALAEYSIGIAKGQDPLVYITVSTGIGCGIVADGKILSGACSSAGELGHLTVEKDGVQCPCGKRGCLEAYSSGTAIAKRISGIIGTQADTKTAFALARSGNQVVSGIINEAADKLGLALSAVYQLIDPAVIVLGGSVTKDYNVFAASLESSLKKYTQPIKNRDFNIKISGFNGKQVILGALIYGNSLLRKDSLK